ncbi:MAG: hypothetical protein ACD_15C00101G0006 [uncultured bacterium]|nr:MAG: hypothetical protein ACD_15C00101G0006 [uncultured bacterium]HCU70513.1 ABC transporter [Candidatus Moranbacteria bacterium]
MEFLNFLQYAFIQKAFLAGSCIALICSILGLFLVLRKMSLIGDGLSHVSFGAIALGLFLGLYPFYVAIPIVVLASFLILKIAEKTKVYGDAAIGIVSAIGISSGVILASLSNGFNVDLFSYLFGNILSISNTEVVLSIALSLIILITIYFFYWDLFSATFDEEYAKTTGIQISSINVILTALTAITVVLAVKMAGIMLVSALIIFPAVSALQISRGFRPAIFISATISLASVILGITLSFFADLPAGATIVILNTFFFILAITYKKITL